MSAKKLLLCAVLISSACSDPDPNQQMDPTPNTPDMGSPTTTGDMNVAPDLGDDGDMGEVVDMSPPPPEEVRYGLSIETLDESTPLSLSAPALVAHPTTGAVILHGGYDKENEVEVGSAWRWENKQWRAIDVSLPSESGHGLAYLPEHARFGIFGNNPDTGWLLWDGEADTSPLTTPFLKSHSLM